MAGEHKTNQRKSFVIMSILSTVVFFSLVFTLTPNNQAFAGLTIGDPTIIYDSPFVGTVLPFDGSVGNYYILQQTPDDGFNSDTEINAVRIGLRNQASSGFTGTMTGVIVKDPTGDLDRHDTISNIQIIENSTNTFSTSLLTTSNQFFIFNFSGNTILKTTDNIHGIGVLIEKTAGIGIIESRTSGVIDNGLWVGETLGTSGETLLTGQSSVVCGASGGNFTHLETVSCNNAFPTGDVALLQVYGANATASDTVSTLEAEKDSFVRQGSPNRNEGANEIIQLRANGNNRALVEFNQTDIENAIGTGALENATLRLYIEENFDGWGANGRTIDAHRITETWAEGNAANLGGNIPGNGDGATWKCAVDTDISDQNKDCATEWDGGNYDGTATDTITITNGQEGMYVEFDVTTDVQDFLDGTEQNHGWIIKKTLEGQAGKLQFTSSDGATNHPELVIHFD